MYNLLGVPPIPQEEYTSNKIVIFVECETFLLLSEGIGQC